MGIIKQNIFFRALLTFQRTGLSCSTSRDMFSSQLWLFTTVFSFWITNYSKFNLETTVNCTNAIMLWESFDSVQSSCSLTKHDDPDHTMMTNTLKRTPCSSHHKHNQNYNHNHNQNNKRNHYLEEDTLLLTPAANPLKRIEMRRASSSPTSSYLVVHLAVWLEISVICIFADKMGRTPKISNFRYNFFYLRKNLSNERVTGDS